ncbi:MAG: hypothetical protein Aurels2KO_03960 [Aureliella sp.]
MKCSHCDVAVEADYPETRLGALPTEHQRFIEMFVLASGSLKEIAKQTGVSYPTVRSRLDRIITELRGHIADSAAGNPTILDAMAGSQGGAKGEDASDVRATAKEMIKRI